MQPPKVSPIPSLAVGSTGDTSVACDPLSALPLEITTSIIQELDWYSLMNIRKTCKHLSNLSRSLPVWRNQLNLYRAEHRYSPPLEEPLEAYSASDLECWVTMRISADAGWKSNNTKPTRNRRMTKLTTSAVCLVPGGRWLLVGSRDGSVTAYDLDASTLNGKLLLQLEVGLKIDRICIGDDDGSSILPFTMAISQAGQDARSDDQSESMIHIWAVTLAGHGREAYLKASHLRSFQVHDAMDIHSVALRKHLFGRIIRTAQSFIQYIETFDWTKSSSSSHCKFVVCRGGEQYHINLLPGNRLLVFTSQDFAIYNVVPVDAGKELLPETARYAFVQPLWRLSCPHNATPLGGISAPASDATATYFTFVMDDTVHDLVIPHGIHQQPRTFGSVAYLPCTNLDSPLEMGLGFEKMFARYICGKIVRLGWARDEGGRIGSVDPRVQCWGWQISYRLERYLATCYLG